MCPKHCVLAKASVLSTRIVVLVFEKVSFLYNSLFKKLSQGFPGGSVVKNPPAKSPPGDTGSIPGLGRSPGEGNGNPRQYHWEIPHGQRSLADSSPWGS